MDVTRRNFIVSTTAAAAGATGFVRDGEAAGRAGGRCGRPCGSGGNESCRARSSLTTMSPRSRGSSMFLSASAQVWPVCLQLQAELNCLR